LDSRRKNTIHLIGFGVVILLLLVVLIVFSGKQFIGKAISPINVNSFPFIASFGAEELIPGAVIEKPIELTTELGVERFLLTTSINEQGLYQDVDFFPISCYPYEEDTTFDCNLYDTNNEKIGYGLVCGSDYECGECIPGINSCPLTHSCVEVELLEERLALLNQESLDLVLQFDQEILFLCEKDDNPIIDGVCGDNTVDTGEECDDGDMNSDIEIDACRMDCKQAYCGDNVVDTGEECDGTENCLDDCTVFVEIPVDPVSLENCPLDGMTNYWNFDENEGSYLFDNIDKLHGEINGATWVEGKSNYGLSFDGQDDFVDLGDYVGQDEIYSITLWMKGTSGTTLHRGNANTCSYNPKISLTSVSESGCQATGALPYLEKLNDDMWHHVIAIRNNNEFSVYVDNKLVNSRTINNHDNNGKFSLGRIWGHINEGSYFNGIIDEVAIFDFVLTEEKITELYNIGLNNQGYCSLPEPGCGNGYVEKFEQCDDGNLLNGDGCNKDCVEECSQMDGLVSYWKAELSAQDYAGSNNGVLVEDVEFTKGILGDAFEFDSNKDWVEITNSESLQVDEDFTIEYWLYPTNVGEARLNPICKAYWGEFCFTIEMENTDKNYLPGRLSYYHGMKDSEGASKYMGWGNSLIENHVLNNQWQHIVITRDATERKITSYYNGEPSGVANYLDIPEKSPSISDVPIKIGQGYTGKVYKGKIDEIAIYNKVLSQGEVKQHYDNILAGESYCLAAVAGCGDGIQEGLEECDDGNLESQDGCSAICKIEECGDSIIQELMNEECDDGNDESEDGCSSECKKEDSMKLNECGVLGYWDADDNFKNMAQNIQCTTQGTVEFTDGVKSKAFMFEENGFVDCENHESFDVGMNDVSLSFWVKTTDDLGDIIRKSSSGYTAGFNHYLTTSQTGSSIFWFKDGTETSNSQYTYSSTDITDGEWHFVVGVLNREEGKMRHYVDGLDVSHPIRNAPLGSISSPTNLYLGSNGFNGIIDEITIWDKALTLEEIISLSQDGVGVKTYCGMEEASDNSGDAATSGGGAGGAGGGGNSN
jgi:cysteine-rich repeat protein